MPIGLTTGVGLQLGAWQHRSFKTAYAAIYLMPYAYIVEVNYFYIFVHLKQLQSTFSHVYKIVVAVVLVIDDD